MTINRRQEKKLSYSFTPFYKRLYNLFITNWYIVLIIINLIIFLWLIRPNQVNIPVFRENITPTDFHPSNVDSIQSEKLSRIQESHESAFEPEGCILLYWQQFSNNFNNQCFTDYYRNDEIHLQSEVSRLNQCYESTNKFYKSPNDHFNFLPIRIIPLAHKKIISFSLYGSSDRYFGSIVKIIRLYKVLLPDWIPRFWLGSDVSFILINRILYEGAEVIIVHQKKDRKPSYHGMFWRFFVSDDENVERYIIRDADSLPIQREIDAINEWIKEGKMFHVMRDHREHAIEILGGMWGGLVDKTILSMKNIYDIAIKHGFDELDGTGPDQRFLQKYLWPIAKKRMTCHVSYRWKFVDSRGCKDFPTPRDGNSFVGAVIGEKYSF